MPEGGDKDEEGRGGRAREMQLRECVSLWFEWRSGVEWGREGGEGRGGARREGWEGWDGMGREGWDGERTRKKEGKGEKCVCEHTKTRVQESSLFVFFPHSHPQSLTGAHWCTLVHTGLDHPPSTHSNKTKPPCHVLSSRAVLHGHSSYYCSAGIER